MQVRFPVCRGASQIGFPGHVSLQTGQSAQVLLEPRAACSPVSAFVPAYTILTCFALLSFCGGGCYREIPVAHFASILQISSATHSVTCNVCSLWRHKTHMPACVDMALESFVFHCLVEAAMLLPYMNYELRGERLLELIIILKIVQLSHLKACKIRDTSMMVK